MPNLEEKQWPRQKPLHCALKASCPRCGKGRLFHGLLKIREKCDHCELDYSFADPADGPAFFVLCFGCLPVVIFLVWLELAYMPPYWMHAVTSLPVLFFTCIPPLRPLKAWLVACEFYHDAKEGSIDNV